MRMPLLIDTVKDGISLIIASIFSSTGSLPLLLFFLSGADAANTPNRLERDILSLFLFLSSSLPLFLSSSSSSPSSCLSLSSPS